jgi:uncharacterized protein YnzC (UPF0291/DUF896 family)
MEQHEIERINELARLRRERALTSQEEAERDDLRRRYIDGFRQSMEQTLQAVRIREADGTLNPLQKKGEPDPRQ